MKFEVFSKNNKKWLRMIYRDGYIQEAMIYGVNTENPYVKVGSYFGKCYLKPETIEQLRKIF